MPTYVSMVNWTASPQPDAAAVRRSFALRLRELRGAGLHSLAFLPDEGACAAVMVSTCRDADAVVRLATRIDPKAMVRVETMQFDDDPGVPSWIVRESTPPPAHALRLAPPRIAVAGT
jgi:hypothetical protein